VDQPLWQPSETEVRRTNMARFMTQVEADWGEDVRSYDALYRFSIENSDRFWTSVRDFATLTAQTWGDRIVDAPDQMPGARWFPDARLNFAENLLRRRDEADAIVFRGEDQVRRRLSHGELYDAVSRLAQALRDAGVTSGERVCAVLPNIPESVVAMLATTSIGAIWSSCSPDFGAEAIIDRFGQIEPKVLFTADGYFYNGKAIDCLERATEVITRIPSLSRVVVVPYAGSDRPAGGVPKGVSYGEFVEPHQPKDIAFASVPFNHPVYILYSSGTTGVPKCIVHGGGGTLLQHVKEHLLHCDIRPDDRVFYFTTCGWMMWNWLVSALASQATLLLYDGSPFHPTGNVLFDFADEEEMSLFGTSAKYIDALAKAGLAPRQTHWLRSLRMMTSTGSPLAPESFDYVYRDIKTDLHLASISGGTDLISCFVLGNPVAPVWRGEIQTPGLGMAVSVFDESGFPVQSGKGELVCTRPFPSMPVCFWNDPDGTKYRAAYFERFPGVWHHGDYVEFTAHGGVIIHGRSDATLNPGGVRIGTAEIYRRVEQMDEVVESVVIGQHWGHDVRIVLFVVLRPGLTLGAALADKIRERIRSTCSPRHVPAKIIQVGDIPRTKNGKISELAVRDVVHGRTATNADALANPQALTMFSDIPGLNV
jgi:acetoacetyl-CoA synthetase